MERQEIEKKYHLGSKSLLKELLTNPVIKKSYDFKQVGKETVTDTYYETQQNFLQNAGLILRVRQIGKDKILTIKSQYKEITLPNGTYTTSKELNFAMKPNETIYDLTMLITKNIPIDVYGRLKLDFTSILQNMKPILIVENKKTIYHCFSNTFKCELIYSELKFSNKETGRTAQDQIFELQLYSDYQNFDEMFKLGRAIEKNVKPVIEYHTTKFEIGLELTASHKPTTRS